MANNVLFHNVKDGDTFKIGTMEFIKFPDSDGCTPVVRRDIAFNSIFGDNNNLKESRILPRLEAEILPQIIEAVGEENVCTFKTDLTAWDGLEPYGELESKISIPTMDFYRANVDVFDKYPVRGWWWLATPDSAAPHYDPIYALCVAPSGFIDFDDCYYYCNGVRPFCILKSNIFVSN